MSLTLSIRLFGGFTLTYGDDQGHANHDRSITEISGSRSQALLAYLLLHRQAPQSRQRIAFHLWPDSADDQARANLRKELSRLRQQLPHADAFLQVETKTLQWLASGNFTLDVAEFEAAVQRAEQATDPRAIQAQFKLAFEQYRGDLLPDLEDEWVRSERDRLQQLYLRVLERLTNLTQAQQDYSTALTYAQQRLRIDEFNEATYVALMRLHDLNGDRAKALQVYHRCMTLLREELGVDPSPTTRQLYEALLFQDSPPPPLSPSPSPSPPSLPPSLPLIGRHQEWHVLQNWAQASNREAAPLLLLTGEPGIGKTRLLEELRASVPIALWGRGFAAEWVRPYGIWIDALRSLPLPPNVPPELGFLLPEIGQPVKAPPDRSHLFDAVVQLLTAWAQQTPLIVLLDDIQWMDEASSALLHYAIRLLSHLPIKFASTARSGELSNNIAVSQLLRALRREQRLNQIELAPFDRGQTAELIHTLNAAYPFDLSLELVDQVFQDSGGNPLFVLEMARALSQQPHLTNHLINNLANNLANNLESLIRDRLDQLEDAARDLLPWAAALGRSFKPAMVAQVANYPMPQLVSAIAQLEQQSIIRPSTTIGNEMGYDFAHDIVRQVVYQQISEPRRQLVHWQIAHQLSQTPAPDDAWAADIAHHAALGGDHFLAAAQALRAAERCLKLFAYAEAAVLAERGVQSCQCLEPSDRVHLQLGLLRVWALAGVTGDLAVQIEASVRQLMQEAKQLGANDDAAIGLETLNVLYFEQNNYSQLHHNSLRSTEVSRRASPAAAARILAFSGSCLTVLGQDMIRAEALLVEAQSLANRVGLEHCDIYIGLGAIAAHKAHYEVARVLFQQALHLAQHDRDRWRECNSLISLVITELEAGDQDAALGYCQSLTHTVAQIEGKESETAVAAALTALAHYQLQPVPAAADLAAAIDQLQQLDIKRMLAYILIGATTVDLSQGHVELAALRAAAALQTAQTMKHPSQIAIAWALLIQSTLARGEIPEAIAQLQALQPQIDHHQLSVWAQTQVDQMMQQIQPFMDQ